MDLFASIDFNDKNREFDRAVIKASSRARAKYAKYLQKAANTTEVRTLVGNIMPSLREDVISACAEEYYSNPNKVLKEVISKLVVAMGYDDFESQLHPRIQQKIDEMNDYGYNGDADSWRSSFEDSHPEDHPEMEKDLDVQLQGMRDHENGLMPPEALDSWDKQQSDMERNSPNEDGLRPLEEGNDEPPFGAYPEEQGLDQFGRPDSRHGMPWGDYMDSQRRSAADYDTMWRVAFGEEMGQDSAVADVPPSLDHDVPGQSGDEDLIEKLKNNPDLMAAIMELMNNPEGDSSEGGPMGPAVVPPNPMQQMAAVEDGDSYHKETVDLPSPPGPTGPALDRGQTPPKGLPAIEVPSNENPSEMQSLNESGSDEDLVGPSDLGVSNTGERIDVSNPLQPEFNVAPNTDVFPMGSNTPAVTAGFGEIGPNGLELNFGDQDNSDQYQDPNADLQNIDSAAMRLREQLANGVGLDQAAQAVIATGIDANIVQEAAKELLATGQVSPHTAKWSAV